MTMWVTPERSEASEGVRRKQKKEKGERPYLYFGGVGLFWGHCRGLWVLGGVFVCLRVRTSIVGLVVRFGGIGGRKIPSGTEKKTPHDGGGGGVIG